MDQIPTITRRRALAAGGAAGAGALVAVKGLGATAAEAAVTQCGTLTPVKTIGPYFVDEALNRSDIRVDTSTGSALSGVALALVLTLVDEDNGCAPLVGAQVDIWHAAPNGKYSDESSEGTTGKTYLRGFQLSDSSGQVRFTTLYPGWYSGRAVHIHIRVRHDSYDFCTQLFFDDTVTSSVYANDDPADYNTRGTRDTLNASDGIYANDSSTLLTLSADGSGGYSAAKSFYLTTSNQGGSTGAGGGGGTPPSGPGGPPSTTTTTTATTTTATTTTATTASTAAGATAAPATTTSSSASPKDTSVLMALVSARFKRTALGRRYLRLALTTQETTTLVVKLRRGSKVIATKTAKDVAAGSRVYQLPVASRIAAGRVTVEVTATDAAGNTRVLQALRQLPKRSAA